MYLLISFADALTHRS